MSDDMFYCSFVSIHYIICECGETFPSEEDLKIHLEREHSHKKERKEFKCGICETLFGTEEACISHYESTHLDIQSEHDYVEVYQPEEFKEDIKDVKVVQEYEELVPTKIEGGGKIKRDKKSRPNYNIKNIICEVCGKKYASNAALKYHQRVHTGERPYKCTECTKSFTMPLFLQIHIRTHTGERPYACPLCPKAFSNKAALLRHDRVHTGVKPYECPQCGKFFTQSNSMKLHVNTVHLKMPAPYKSKNRRNKAKEREILKEAIFGVIDNEDSTAAESISQNENLSQPELQYIKPEVDLYEQEVEESQILLEDGEEITYEVVYEGE